MYNELYKIWKQELANNELTTLSPDFFSKIAGYLKKLEEESRMLDKKTLRASLLEKETQNVERMISELITERYNKLIVQIANGKRIASNVLTEEEETVCAGFTPLVDTFHIFTNRILRGDLQEFNKVKSQKRVVLRFLKDVPEIVGADMATYGPFKVEDVASVPVENSIVIVKKGLAKKVEA